MKTSKTKLLTYFVFSIFFLQAISAQPYKDQFYQLHDADSLIKYAENMTNLKVADDGVSLTLVDNTLTGEYILKPQNFTESFNRGLPSWNGKAPENENSSLKIYMRFEIDGLWQSWVIVGYWDNNIWSSYGSTAFSAGEVDVDYVVLTKYCSKFQYKVLFERKSYSAKSPMLRQLAFSTSDSQTAVSIDDIVADCPDQIYINTTHYYQYGLDPVIGGSICSPTSVSMIIKSYGIQVNPLDFAKRTYDEYWQMFGVWPRVVAHASEYGLNGVVNRYRTWSEAAEVLKKGGRIAMSIGQPLYTGHLVMLAGFDQNGDPLVHDPAKSNGEGYHFNKTDLSKAWFNKGGIAYTFYRESSPTSVKIVSGEKTSFQCFPNPVSSNTIFEFQLGSSGRINLSLFDLQGKLVSHIDNGYYSEGKNRVQWNRDSGIKKGVYFAVLQTDKLYYSYKIYIQ